MTPDISGIEGDTTGAMDGDHPEFLWEEHVGTGEPLLEGEVWLVVAAGITKANEWEDRGGGLYWHAPTWPSTEQ